MMGWVFALKYRDALIIERLDISTFYQHEDEFGLSSSMLLY
jgi:hypothetical protein